MTHDPHTTRTGHGSEFQERLLTRRDLISTATAVAATTVARRLSAEPVEDDRVSFILVGDTHYLASREMPDRLDDRSRRVTTGLIDTLNTLPGAKIPDSAGGGAVARPHGVSHAGDLIDSGDKNGKIWEKMQATEWKAFTADFGVDGKNGRLSFPVFEVHGNHDGPHGRGLAVEGIVQRNKDRVGLSGLSENGLHCSWDWGPVHFLNLGIVVGQVPEVRQRRRYAPMDSLEFLIADLNQRVGDSDRPVIISHHIDLARYTTACDADDPANQHREWHPCDVRGFFNAIHQYNVIAILHGHTHVRNVLSWDGKSTRSDKGVSVFNVDNSSHFQGEHQAFLYFEIGPEEMLVRECATKDGWQSHFWTPQVWKRSVRSAP